MGIGTTALITAGVVGASAISNRIKKAENDRIAERNRIQHLEDRKHQELREDTAVQRRVADMQQAGISAHGATGSVSHAAASSSSQKEESEEEITDILKALMPLAILLAKKS